MRLLVEVPIVEDGVVELSLNLHEKERRESLQLHELARQSLDAESLHPGLNVPSRLLKQSVRVPLGIIEAAGVRNGDKFLQGGYVGLPEVLLDEGVDRIFVKIHSIIQEIILLDHMQDQPILGVLRGCPFLLFGNHGNIFFSTVGDPLNMAAIISNYFSIISSSETGVQMQRPYTSGDANHFLSPDTARHRPYLSPRDGQNRKKEREREYDGGNGGKRQKMRREKDNNEEHTGRRSNGSLRKHQYFGKIPSSPAHHETPLNGKGSKSKQITQQIDHTSKQRSEAAASSTRGNFQWGAAIQEKGVRSQYYHSQQIPTGQPGSRQPGRCQRKQREMEGMGLGKIEEVTFSMDSTEPETEQKSHPNQYQMVERKGKKEFLEAGGSSSSGQFITAFRKKIIEREIAEKEKVYRAYIRSSSRENNLHEKGRLKSKMKEVLDDLYQLNKLIKK